MKTKLSTPPYDVDPTPMTVEGTHALVERFYVLNPGARRFGAPPTPHRLVASKTKLAKSLLNAEPKSSSTKNKKLTWDELCRRTNS